MIIMEDTQIVKFSFRIDSFFVVIDETYLSIDVYCLNTWSITFENYLQK